VLQILTLSFPFLFLHHSLPQTNRNSEDVDELRLNNMVEDEMGLPAMQIETL
jgi:hypothetical protein